MFLAEHCNTPRSLERDGNAQDVSTSRRDLLQRPEYRCRPHLETADERCRHRQAAQIDPATKELFMTNPTAASNPNVVDVRTLVPAQRHAKIFQLVNQLAPGGSFVLVNDHDPKPLYYQLEAEYPKQFSWTYLERGPAVWRVEIGKLAKAA
jgi:uncharacterized protein (DUF2249 family)